MGFWCKKDMGAVSHQSNERGFWCKNVVRLDKRRGFWCKKGNFEKINSGRKTSKIDELNFVKKNKIKFAVLE